MPEVRCSWLASVQRGCVHCLGELSSTSGVDGSVMIVLVLLLVKRWDSRTVGENVRPVGEGCGLAMVLVGVRG